MAIEKVTSELHKNIYLYQQNSPSTSSQRKLYPYACCGCTPIWWAIFITIFNILNVTAGLADGEQTRIENTHTHQHLTKAYGVATETCYLLVINKKTSETNYL